MMAPRSIDMKIFWSFRELRDWANWVLEDEW